MQVLHPGDQRKLCPRPSDLVAQPAINAGGAMLLPIPVQVTESIPGSVVPLAIWIWKHALVCLLIQIWPCLAATRKSG